MLLLGRGRIVLLHVVMVLLLRMMVLLLVVHAGRWKRFNLLLLLMLVCVLVRWLLLLVLVGFDFYRGSVGDGGHDRRSADGHFRGCWMVRKMWWRRDVLKRSVVGDFVRRRWLLLGVDLRGSSAVIVWGHLHLLHLRRSVLVNVWRRMIQGRRMVKMWGRLMMHRSQAGRGSAQFRSCLVRMM